MAGRWMDYPCRQDTRWDAILRKEIGGVTGAARLIQKSLQQKMMNMNCAQMCGMCVYLVLSYAYSGDGSISAIYLPVYYQV